ncbi:hypothetical protein DdX_05696 [Ditylenchus destructor]|uniref:Uncharacterized protein n=1 Tax=Ditylenchus destructor TaxID=166010 RepID=A0AAD4R3M2_9BILA|nr:hypothetical protein DdX_05696 [Ditylenchus destructor]
MCAVTALIRENNQSHRGILISVKRSRCKTLKIRLERSDSFAEMIFRCFFIAFYSFPSTSPLFAAHVLSLRAAGSIAFFVGLDRTRSGRRKGSVIRQIFADLPSAIGLNQSSGRGSKRAEMDQKANFATDVHGLLPDESL